MKGKRKLRFQCYAAFGYNQSVRGYVIEEYAEAKGSLRFRILLVPELHVTPECITRGMERFYVP